MPVKLFDPASMTEPGREDAVWAAGVIEGEGCIRIQLDRPKDFRSGKPVDRTMMAVCVSMKDEAVILKLFAIFGGHHYVRGDGLHVLTLSSNRALWALERIEPWLVGDKKPQARLAIEFQRGRRHGTRSAERKLWELDAARRISEMKKVGVYGTKKGPKAHRMEAEIARRTKPAVLCVARRD